MLINITHRVDVEGLPYGCDHESVMALTLRHQGDVIAADTNRSVSAEYLTSLCTHPSPPTCSASEGVWSWVWPPFGVKGQQG